MRVWDLPPAKLCDKHLLGQHREIHAMYSTLTNINKRGYRKHPETMRWSGICLLALYAAHTQTELEMGNRGMKTNSPLQYYPAQYAELPLHWQPIEQQIAILKSKGCGCKV